MTKDLNYYLKLPYRIVLHPSPEGGYAAEIPELPGCISQGQTIEEALKMIEDAKLCWLESAIEDGAIIPEPVPEDFSGRLNIRIPKTLHQALAERAKNENTSLNQYILYQLARAIGYSQN
ncbi:MAG TPA: toxin-antitoxin system HicB family antitoxin [Clostridia bacterium]|jgi:antitoxin HicB|nr:toxin-antitoxin system HicB family antitoxin [Clostridia bacterium]